MEKLIAFCGIDCASCDARIATMNNDDALRAVVADKWAKEFSFAFTPAMIQCVGCQPEGAKIGHCSDCAMRACGLSRGVRDCGACADYTSCAKIGEFLAMVPAAKANLEAGRA